MAVRSSRRWGWWGIAFVVAFVASIPAGNALTVGKSLYLPGASAAELRDFGSLVLVVSAKSAGDGIVAGLGKATLLSGGALHLVGLALLVTGSSVVALRAGTRTRWVFHYGRIIGPLLTLSAVSVGWPPLMKVEVLWRLLAVVWIVGVAVAALRGRIGNGHAARPAHPVGVEA